MPLTGQIALPPLTALLDLTTQKQCKPPVNNPLIHISDPCRHLHQDDGLRTPTFSNRHASGYGQIHFPWLENTGVSTPVFSSSSPPEHDPTKAEEGSDDQVIFVKEFTFLGNTVFPTRSWQALWLRLPIGRSPLRRSQTLRKPSPISTSITGMSPRGLTCPFSPTKA